MLLSYPFPYPLAASALNDIADGVNILVSFAKPVVLTGNAIVDSPKMVLDRRMLLFLCVSVYPNASVVPDCNLPAPGAAPCPDWNEVKDSFFRKIDTSRKRFVSSSSSLLVSSWLFPLLLYLLRH